MSTVTIRPSAARGVIKAPPSKSMAHRALICAALADGKSMLTNIAMSEDIGATVGALRALGAEICVDEAAGTALVRPGAGDVCDVIDCRESGSTLRFILPLCLLDGKERLLKGSGRLPERPLGVYEALFKEQGILLDRTAEGIRVKGALRGGDFRVRGDISSQFITGLLLALPMLPEQSRVIVTTEMQSAPYVRMTRQVQKAFGVNVREIVPAENVDGQKAERIYYSDPESHYHSADYDIEGDWSNAAYLELFGLTGSDIRITGLAEESLQGDKIYREYFRRIADSSACPGKRDSASLPQMDIRDCPDLGPALIAAAMIKHGAVLTGTSRLAVKESDRGRAMAEEAAKFGVHITVNEDSIIVPDTALKTPEAPLSGHGDHRIVMALAALASVTGGVITGAEAVNKSFPDFFDRIRKAGIDFDRIN